MDIIRLFCLLDCVVPVQSHGNRHDNHNGNKDKYYPQTNLRFQIILFSFGIVFHGQVPPGSNNQPRKDDLHHAITTSQTPVAMTMTSEMNVIVFRSNHTHSRAILPAREDKRISFRHYSLHSDVSEHHVHYQPANSYQDRSKAYIIEYYPERIVTVRTCHPRVPIRRLSSLSIPFVRPDIHRTTAHTALCRSAGCRRVCPHHRP